jgi:hypothetical protein
VPEWRAIHGLLGGVDHVFKKNDSIYLKSLGGI